MIATFARRVLLLAVLAAGSVSAWGTIIISPQSGQLSSSLTVGQTFSQQFFSTAPGATWSVTLGALPPGLTLNATTGLLSGQLLQSGPYAFVLQASTSTDSGTASYFVNIIGGPLTVNTNSFSARASTGPYSAQLTGLGGAPPYTWALGSTQGTNGLTLSNTGLISGTLITPGVTTLNVIMTDSQRSVATVPLLLFVIGITTTSLPPAPLGVSYSQTLTVAGAQPPVTWTLTGANPLPQGFALSAQGVLAGSALTSGVYTFSVSVTDFIQNTATAQLTLVTGSTFSITTTSLPDASIGANYSQVLQTAGGAAPYTWSATGLPAGLTLDSTTGTLHGAPTTAGTQTIAVTVTDSTMTTAHANLSLTVGSLTISTSVLPSGVVGSSYSAALSVSGNQTPLVWSISSGALPGGLTLNANSGSITGTPTAAGSFPFTVSVNYAAGSITVQKPLTIVISLASGLTITTNAILPAATVNVAYSLTLAASGGKAPYTWAVMSGLLPTGLSLSPAGVISGTPPATGSVSFTIGVTDSAQAFFNQVFSLTVLPSTFDFTTATRLAQVVDGGNFITQFAIVNLDATPVSYQFRFWGDSANPLNLPILNGTAGTLSGTLNSGAIAFAQTTGTSAPSTASALQGWAEVAATGRVGVTAIFKRSVPGSADSEATVSGSTSSGAISLPFDNTQGYATGIAIANTNALQALSITLAFEFENGGSSIAVLALPPHAHTAFVLPTAYTATAGLRGVVHFTAFSPDISVVGLRFSPNNSFTSLGAFQ